MKEYKRRRKGVKKFLSISIMLALNVSVASAVPSLEQTDLFDQTLEDLLNFRISSVSKKEETIRQAPAAVFVLTQEDIRRAAATTLPELLRMVPGMQVAQIDSHNWGISARGFNDLFGNKLLVLIDGRSVYTHLHSGVYWDMQDVVLEDIERIEVIRGPGATLWGANAVNGVINIITKQSEETVGGLVSVSAGNEEKVIGSARYGVALGEHAYLRGYVKHSDHDASLTPQGKRNYDEWNKTQGGFRLDWSLSDRDVVTLSGDAFEGDMQTETVFPLLTPPFSRTAQQEGPIKGRNVLSRWTRKWSDSSETRLQFYYTAETRKTALEFADARTVDSSIEHQWKVTSWNEVTAGLGYRYITDDTTNDSISRGELGSRILPSEMTLRTPNGFVQDQITLTDKIKFIIGAKFEDNPFVGFISQPSIKLLYTISPSQTAWGAVSRALRTPSRVDRGIHTDAEVVFPQGNLPLLIRVEGDEHFKAEKLTAYELGYKASLSRTCSFDVALFYNNYKDLASFSSLPPQFEYSPPPHLIQTLIRGNGEEGNSFGGEAVVNWSPINNYKIQAWYAYLNTSDLREALIIPEPNHQAMIRLFVPLPGNIEFTPAFRYVDSSSVDAYTQLDARLGYNVTKDVTVSLVGQRLLKGSQEEAHYPFGRTQPAQVERGVFGQIVWKF